MTKTEDEIRVEDMQDEKEEGGWFIHGSPGSEKSVVADTGSHRSSWLSDKDRGELHFSDAEVASNCSGGSRVTGISDE